MATRSSHSRASKLGCASISRAACSVCPKCSHKRRHAQESGRSPLLDRLTNRRRLRGDWRIAAPACSHLAWKGTCTSVAFPKWLPILSEQFRQMLFCHVEAEQSCRWSRKNLESRHDVEELAKWVGGAIVARRLTQNHRRQVRRPSPVAAEILEQRQLL